MYGDRNQSSGYLCGTGWYWLGMDMRWGREGRGPFCILIQVLAIWVFRYMKIQQLYIWDFCSHSVHVTLKFLKNQKLGGSVEFHYNSGLYYVINRLDWTFPHLRITGKSKGPAQDFIPMEKRRLVSG